MYNVQYFIKKFEAIPEELWTTRVYSYNGKCCALGHCGINPDLPETDWNDEVIALIKIFGPKVVAPINDGLDPRYPQPTPKQRVLAALRDVERGLYV